MTTTGAYRIGTASVAADDTAVTGQGTSWALQPRPGDLFHARGLSVPIARVESNTALTLDYGWPGADLDGADYRILYTAEASRALATSIEVDRKLSILDANGRGLFFNLLPPTGNVDPGPGNLALNASAPQNVTEAYASLLDANNLAIDKLIDLFGPTELVKFRGLETFAYAAYTLTEAPAKSSGYRRFSLEYVQHDGVIGEEPIAIEWNWRGEIGPRTEFRYDGQSLQYRPIGEGAWADLIAREDFVSPAVETIINEAGTARDDAVGARNTAVQARDDIEKNLFVYVTDDANSVTVQVGASFVVAESETPYPTVTLELVA